MKKQAREKIVIGSNSIAIRDLIQDGENGFLFEYDDPRDLAEKINLALDSDEEIAENARNSVEDFNWDSVSEKLEKIYSE